MVKIMDKIYLMINKTLHRKLKAQHELYKNRRRKPEGLAIQYNNLNVNKGVLTDSTIYINLI